MALRYIAERRGLHCPLLSYQSFLRSLLLGVEREVMQRGKLRSRRMWLTLKIHLLSLFSLPPKHSQDEVFALPASQKTEICAVGPMMDAATPLASTSLLLPFPYQLSCVNHVAVCHCQHRTGVNERTRSSALLKLRLLFSFCSFVCSSFPRWLCSYWCIK